MESLTVEQVIEKYKNIEEKIPSLFKNYEEAGVNLAQDLCFHWDVTDHELIRIISLLEIRVPGLMINQHVDRKFAFAGLYPNIIKML